jgi:hypothetical protein
VIQLKYFCNKKFREFVKNLKVVPELHIYEVDNNGVFVLWFVLLNLIGIGQKVTLRQNSV